MHNKIYSVEEIKDSLKNLFSNYDVDKVTLFGSYAKKTATKDSDIDLLIDSNGRLKGFKLFSLISKIEEVLKKDVDAFEIISNSKIDKEIKETGIIIYEK